MNNFWTKLKKPFSVLAPMADVTDAAFRQLIAKYSRPIGPDVFYTEFISLDGLFKRPQVTKERVFSKGVYDRYGQIILTAESYGVAPDNPLLLNLLYTEAERPIVAQVFTADPAMMQKGAVLIKALGFDGLDINMGCPDRSIEKQGCGAALIKNPVLARELIRAAQAGAGSMPVAVKTRAGYSRDEIEDWIPELLKAQPAVLTLHARTRKEMSKVTADWSRVRRTVEIRDQLSSSTLIAGNGDIQTPTEGRERAGEVGADGAMIGRGVFGNPWLWSDYHPTIKDRLEVLVEHTKLFEKFFVGHQNFAVMKKHYQAYVTGWDGAKELRVKLMDTRDGKEVDQIVENYLQQPEFI